MDTIPVEISPEILRLIAGIDEFKGAWRAFKNIAPDRLNLLRKVATIESVGSSTRIEGAKLTDGEVERLLSGVGLERFHSRDEEEVAGYAEAMTVGSGGHGQGIVVSPLTMLKWMRISISNRRCVTFILN